MREIAIFLFFLVFSCISGYKLLVVFPFPSKSHSILGHGYVKHLLKAGHEVTYITPYPMKNPSPALRQIDVSSNTDFETLPINIKGLLNNEVVINDVRALLNFMYTATYKTIMNENVQKFIMEDNVKFDAVVVEWLYSELYSGFASVFNCPYIWSSSMEPHSMVLSLIDEIPNPAYIPDHNSNAVPPLSFFQRIGELWETIKIEYVKWTRKDMEELTFKNAFGPAVAKRGRTLPALNEIRYNASLMLGNSHVSSGLAIRLPQNYKPIAGFYINSVLEPMSENLQKIMDTAPNGVIYFSLGSILPGKDMPNVLKRGLLDIFKGLKQIVIWKLEEVLPDLPKNVHIVDWAPQQSILAHPNCVLFITHGGLLSSIESLYFGVPIIGIPLFADQFSNIKRAVSKGYALEVELGMDVPGKLKNAIEEIFRNPRYREKVKQLSLVYHDRVALPSAELVHWVEHVVRTGGAPHLRSLALLVPWYQKMYLDLAVLVLLISLIIFRTVSTVSSYYSRYLVTNVDSKKKKIK